MGRFLAARGDNPAPVTSRPELKKIVDEFDRLYWTHAEKLVEDLATRQGDRLMFTKYERMFLDLGLVDLKMIPNADNLKTDLVRELYTRDRPTHTYFSEWLTGRYRTFILTGKLERQEAPAAPVAEDSETAQYKEARRRIYTAVRPLFDNLPGFPATQIDLLFSGRIDTMIADLSATLATKEDPRAADQRRHLTEMRSRMMTRARERATKDEELKFFDALSKVDAILATRVSAAPAPRLAAGGQTAIINPNDRAKFLKDELKIVRQNIKLGTIGSGVTRTCSILFTAENRCKKADLAPVLASVRECDPTLPPAPNIMIGPYIGTGFYEWDRDTVFAPLSPTRSVEESIVNALANYRMILDAQQGAGRLKRAYEMKFEKADFRQGFLRDYKNWVLGVGKGFRGALPPESFDFFKQHLGPSPDDFFAPSDLARLTPEERVNRIKDLRRKINAAEGEFEDYYALAVMYWKEGQPSQALDNLAAAVKLYPVDGRAMFTLGHLCFTLGMNPQAKDALHEVINIARNTLWHIYAADVLQRM